MSTNDSTNDITNFLKVALLQYTFTQLLPMPAPASDAAADAALWDDDGAGGAASALRSRLQKKKTSPVIEDVLGSLVDG